MLWETSLNRVLLCFQDMLRAAVKSTSEFCKPPAQPLSQGLVLFWPTQSRYPYASGTKGRICPNHSWTLSSSLIKYVLGVGSSCCSLIIPSGQNFQNFSKWPLVVVTCLDTRDQTFPRRQHRKLLLKLKWQQGVHCCWNQPFRVPRNYNPVFNLKV